ncbi:hypothetical protein FRC10_008951 [Ceratobasidium sp. 414]|nr:hypothetical protein FRC10_008951 [Ceratobasidium sp. 414]
MSSPSSSTTPGRGAPPKRLTLTPGLRPLHLGTGSFPSPSRSTSSPLATPPTTAPLPPRRLGSVSHIARDDLAIDNRGEKAGRSGLVRGGSLREAGGRRGKHGASASVALGGAGEGALERAREEVFERKRMSASLLGTGSEDQPAAVLTLAEKHKDLLHFIAQKESKCVELRAQLAAHEADLLQLKKKWEKIVAKGNGQGRVSDSHTGLSLGRLDATGAVDLVRGIFGGLGELATPSPSATPATPSSSSSVSTPNHTSSPLPSGKPALVTRPTASKGHLAHTPKSSSSSNSTVLSSGTTATRLSLSSASSLGGAEQLKETKGTAEPVGEDEDMDAWGPFESVQTEEPESAGALGLSGVEDKAAEKNDATTNENNQSWVPTAVGKKWEELRGTETYAKSTKRASTLLSDVSSALTTTLNALAPPPAPSLTRPGTVGGISPRPSSSIKLTTTKSKPSTPSKPPPAPISTSARPNSTLARPVSLLDDDDGNESAGLGAVLQPSPSVSTRSKLSDPGSSKLGSDTFGEDWNW